MHASRPDSTPALHNKKNELFIHWPTLDDRRKERESQKVFWRRRKLPRCAFPSPYSSHHTAPPGKERKNQDGVGQEWDKSGPR